LACRQVGGSMNLSYTCRDHKNYLQTRRQRELAYGQAGSMLKYFQAKISENPFFHYTFQLDIDENITNIFWVDAKMLIDYAHFGDVVTFDTTFVTNKEYRPFGVLLDSISLERLLFLVLLFFSMKQVLLSNGFLMLF
jgi:zinc finger SWIM domain-containing protein 3